jgi:hypothetical protein
LINEGLAQKNSYDNAHRAKAMEQEKVFGYEK